MTLEEQIRENLSEDLLTPEWRAHLKKYKLNRFAGHCYTASEAFYHLKGKELGYKPYWVKVMSFPMWDTIVTHWYLRKGKHIVDLTADQFKGGYIPYTEGCCCGFLTKKPSMRTRELIARISE